MDYCWISTTGWQSIRWGSTLFNTTIPNFVKKGFIDFRNLNFKNQEPPCLYLPFCRHCLIEIVAAYREISECYTIQFLTKEKLPNNVLWEGTSHIDVDKMQNILGKNPNQEEQYCKVTKRELDQMNMFGRVTKEDVISVYNKIDRVDDVRMIRLEVLHKYNPDFTSRPKILGVDIGGFIGLKL